MKGVGLHDRGTGSGVCVDIERRPRRVIFRRDWELSRAVLEKGFIMDWREETEEMISASY
jgi:hypothetical protein